MDSRRAAVDSRALLPPSAVGEQQDVRDAELLLVACVAAVELGAALEQVLASVRWLEAQLEYWQRQTQSLWFGLARRIGLLRVADPAACVQGLQGRLAAALPVAGELKFWLSKVRANAASAAARR